MSTERGLLFVVCDLRLFVRRYPDPREEARLRPRSKHKGAGPLIYIVLKDDHVHLWRNAAEIGNNMSRTFSWFELLKIFNEYVTHTLNISVLFRIG